MMPMEIDDKFTNKKINRSEKSRTDLLHKNTKVITMHGVGVIVGVDIPQSIAWRWLVRITEPNNKGTEILKSPLFTCGILAYQDREVKCT